MARLPTIRILVEAGGVVRDSTQFAEIAEEWVSTMTAQVETHDVSPVFKAQ